MSSPTSPTPDPGSGATKSPTPRGSSRMRWAIVLTVLVVGGLLGFGGAALFGRSDPAQPSGDGALPGAAANSHVLDDAGREAPTLVEFLDFECEACGALHPVLKDVRTKYDGKINYVIRYFPLSGHANSVPAALAVEAAAQQGRTEDMANMLLESQQRWGERQEPMAGLFRSYAQQLGLDMAAYDAAVADQATVERIKQDFDEGVSMGVETTPTFFLDGEKLTLQRLSDLTDPIDKAIADRGADR